MLEGYTDIHCHILPRVDDGARNMEQAMGMLHMAYDEGIRTVVLTPHFHGGHMESDAGTNADRLEKLRELVSKDKAISDMKLYLGNEIYYYDSMCEWLEEGRVTSMNGSKYVLVEFGFTWPVRNIENAIRNICNEGYKPIIAHVERYDELYNDIDMIEELIRMGAYIQINTESVNGFLTKSFIRKLLKNEMVHFVATDAHSMGKRRPLMKDAAMYIEKKYGSHYAEKLFIENPRCVIEDEYIS